MEGIRRLEELIAANSEIVTSDIHAVVLALLVEVKDGRGLQIVFEKYH